jgi:hypothetical protein
MKLTYNFDFVESKKKDFVETLILVDKYAICDCDIYCLLMIYRILLIALAKRSEKNHTHVFHYFTVIDMIWYRSKLNRLQLHHERIRKHKLKLFITEMFE